MADVVEFGTFEETRKGTAERIKFKVTTVPEEIAEDVVEHMTKYFYTREPMSKHFDLIKDPVGVKIEQKGWRKCIEEGTATVAIKEGPQPLKNRIIGVSMNYVSSKDDKHELPKDEDWGVNKEVYLAAREINLRANVFEKFNVDKILKSAGLSVHPDYHGYSVGERLIECREPICRQLGIKVAATIFSAPASIHLANKLGYQVVYEEEYSKFRYQGKAVFEGIPGKFEYCALLYS